MQVNQQLVCAIAELLQLTSLHILHGSLTRDLYIAQWSSLKHLAELKLLPAEAGGLTDAQVGGRQGCIAGDAAVFKAFQDGCSVHTS